METSRQSNVDNYGNSWFIDNNVVTLKLASESYIRRLGLISNDRFIVYRNRETHLFKKANSYGFNAEVIEGLFKFNGIKFVDLYDDYGMYRLDIRTIKNGAYLFFKEEGFEKQLFVPLEVVEQNKVQLEEDVLRRGLLGDTWFNELRAEFHKPYWNKLGVEVARRRNIGLVYPEKEDVFKAFKLTPYNEVKVVIIGQDPYYNGVADGLSFSSKDELRMPPSLQKIYDAIEKDVKWGLYLNQDTSLEYLARQGVLLLNTCLTVDAGFPSSHRGIGWENFITRVLESLKHHHNDLVIMLWGTYAKGLKHTIDNGKHLVLEAEHPAYAAREGRDWVHNHAFKKSNQFLEAKGYGEINW